MFNSRKNKRKKVKALRLVSRPISKSRQIGILTGLYKKLLSSAPPGSESSNWILSPVLGMWHPRFRCYCCQQIFFDGITTTPTVSAKLSSGAGEAPIEKNENSEMQFAVIFACVQICCLAAVLPLLFLTNSIVLCNSCCCSYCYCHCCFCCCCLWPRC